MSLNVGHINKKVYVRRLGNRHVEFYKGRGGSAAGLSMAPFYTCANRLYGEEFISALRILGHVVIEIKPEQS